MKKYWWTIIIILTVIILAYFLMNNQNPNTDAKTAKCIGKNSVLYVQLGCHDCETQENLFGENYKYLNVVDCFYEKEKCTRITRTPTWEIQGVQFKGVQSIEELKKMARC